MKYLLIEHGDGNDPKVVRVFDDVDSRAKATREAILGPDDAESKDLPCPELLTLAEGGIVHFEGDPSIEWIDAEVPELERLTKERDAVNQQLEVKLHQVQYIRCSQHLEIPQQNSSEHTGAECGGCLTLELRAYKAVVDGIISITADAEHMNENVTVGVERIKKQRDDLQSRIQSYEARERGLRESLTYIKEVGESASPGYVESIKVMTAKAQQALSTPTPVDEELEHVGAGLGETKQDFAVANPHIRPKGKYFYGKHGGGYREMVLVEEGPETGWVCYKHPDGYFVTLRKATEQDIKDIDAAISKGTHE